MSEQTYSFPTPRSNKFLALWQTLADRKNKPHCFLGGRIAWPEMPWWKCWLYSSEFDAESQWFDLCLSMDLSFLHPFTVTLVQVLIGEAGVGKTHIINYLSLVVKKLFDQLLLIFLPTRCVAWYRPSNPRCTRRHNWGRCIEHFQTCWEKVGGREYEKNICVSWRSQCVPSHVCLALWSFVMDIKALIV